MRRGVSIRRFAVGLLAACFGWVLPAHHHAPGDGHHSEAHAAAGGPDAHHGDQHHDGGSGDERSPSRGHGEPCDVCYAARTLYTPVAVAPPPLGLDGAGASSPVDPDQVVSLRLTPVYRGRAPPAACL